jgi:hypothetical protein
MFSLEFALPAELAGKESIEISVEASKTFRVANDSRDLGMAFGTFGIH